MDTVGKIAIVGAGAVGCYYGGRLAQSGQDVHFLMRSDYETVMRDGLHITSPLGDANLRVNAYRGAADIGPCDLVIIALKATSNNALLDLLPPLVGRTLPPEKEGTLMGRCAESARPAHPGSVKQRVDSEP